MVLQKINRNQNDTDKVRNSKILRQMIFQSWSLMNFAEEFVENGNEVLCYGIAFYKKECFVKRI